MYQLLALLTGLILAIMISINGNLTDQYGVFTASVIIHIVGVIFAYMLCVLKKERQPIRRHSPKWIYLGGALGVIPTLCNNFSFGHISLTSIVALGLLGQTIASLTIDGLGLFGMKRRPFQKESVIGFVFALIGIVLMLDHSITAVVHTTLSLLSGVAVVLSRTVNSRLSDNIGALRGSLVNHLVGLPITIVIALIASVCTSTTINTAAPFRPWIYLGGTLGVLTVLLCNLTVPKVSSFKLTVLTFIGQIFTGILLDLIIGGDYSQTSFVGGVVIALGIAVNMIVEQIQILKK